MHTHPCRSARKAFLLMTVKRFSAHAATVCLCFKRPGVTLSSGDTHIYIVQRLKDYNYYK